jgi:hypothetical protein
MSKQQMSSAEQKNVAVSADAASTCVEVGQHLIIVTGMYRLLLPSQNLVRRCPSLTVADRDSDSVGGICANEPLLSDSVRRCPS